MASLMVENPVAKGVPRGARDRRPAREVAVERASDLLDAISEAATIRAARDRAHSERAVPDRMSGYLTGGSVVVALGAWLLAAPPAVIPLGLLVACVAAHAAAASIEFEIGPGTALPTTPVLWVSLFLLPPQLVPIVALAGLMIAAFVARLRDPDRRERLPVLVSSSHWRLRAASVPKLSASTRWPSARSSDATPQPPGSAIVTASACPLESSQRLYVLRS
jgi:hypothetical protein